MAPSAVSPPPTTTGTLLVKPWSRPQETKEDLDWAPLTTIDLSRFDEPGGKQDLAKQLYDAITRVGFWVVTGTGIDDERILRQFSIGNTFFKEPLDEKRRFPCNFAEGEYFGYRENERWIGDTGVKENIEMLNIHKDIPAWTQVGRHRVVEDNWDEIRNFHRDVWEVARKLFVLIAIILELPENYLADAHAYDEVSDDHLRYMIYNVRTDEEWDKAQAYSKGGHTDFGSLTLLFSQHVAGLQIRTPEGDWKYVKPVEGGITCNAADTLTFLTNGFIKSTIHRVVKPPRDQIDIPRLGLLYFSRPGDHTPMRTVPSPLLDRLGLIREEDKDLSKPVPSGTEDADQLAKIESIDAGKPVKLAKVADVLACAACFRYYAGWADKIKGDSIETDPNMLNLTLREPLGVCGLIIPWNFPILMCGWKLGPALAAGNVAVLKPAELTPLSALYLGKLIVEAEFPPGVVNIVPGLGHEAGAALSNHPDVAKVSFTGSTAVGKGILHASADSNLKKVTLELGGKSPSIVFGSADLDEVVEWVNGGIFYNMGQNCCASSRVFVHESVYESFITKFVERARKNQLGDPFDDKTFLGPQISGSQHSKIMGMIENAKTQGAICATGGRSPSGWFIEPTIFRDVKVDMGIAREEVFGPVVAVASFRDEEEALEMAHDTCYGLAAAVFTSDIKQGIKMAKELEAGTVWVNCYNKISHALPFGGYRQSGNGKDLGEDAIYGFTQLKTIGIML
ncbi:Aldehyde dehydrogenase [Colletotrichum siamense]|uniref:Aldehyde dehydrogenase n=1 Tax=Colletotrichum siamense TaxID=690259 RepID=UPI0018729C92|nr:Aldehyde dehydrogenase [Colletotrichum siamense]KAF5500407.1 Aldehyde dehydrogenase [Colletotrichum siamense]